MFKNLYFLGKQQPSTLYHEIVLRPAQDHTAHVHVRKISVEASFPGSSCMQLTRTYIPGLKSTRMFLLAVALEIPQHLK